MAGRDDDKTVFGGTQAPQPGPRRDTPAPDATQSPFQPPQPASGRDDRTVIGGPAPQPQQGGGAVPSSSPFGQPQQPGWGQPPAGGGTWLGGPVAPPQPAYPQHGYPPQQPQGWQGQGQNPFGIGAAPGQDRGFFPDLPRDQPRAAPLVGPKIPLQQALQVKGLGKGASSNPLLAAAASLLILLGRLRTGLVEMQAGPLMEHVTREIDQFERNALQAGINPHQAAVAKYILSGTADDIVQNLPGADRGDWLQYSMVARFFGKRDSGVGFFQEAEKAMQAPGQNYNLLELILTGLSLGFEGQYRTLPNGSVELARIRTAIYETLRRVQPRPDEDVSVMWTPVALGKGRRFGAVSIPAVLGIAAIAIVGFYAALSTLINRDGAQAAEALRNLHQGNVTIAIERPPGPVYVAKDDQLDRIRAAFAPEIQGGLMEVGEKGDYIYVRVGNLQLFDSAAFEVKPEFAPMAARITQVLNDEGGPVLVQGFTDNVPMSGRGQFKTNDELSQARAASVSEALAATIDDPARITVEGRGEADPVGDNATDEGRSANRRVEVMLGKEGTY